jgi:ribulose-phosphate 3-epimerase
MVPGPRSQESYGGGKAPGESVMSDSSSRRADRVERASLATTLRRHAVARDAARNAPHLAVRAVESAGADRLHLDIMDGRFVPNLSFGLPVVRALRKGTGLPLAAHLMIEQPERYLEDFVEAGASTVIEHQEVSPHLHRTIQRIRGLGARPAVVINPATPPTFLGEVIEAVDLVLVMTVNPGFGGQSFIPEMLDNVCRTASMLQERNPGCELAVDGGVDVHTAPALVAAGANALVAGSAIFGHPDGPAAGLRELAAAVNG